MHRVTGFICTFVCMLYVNETLFLHDKNSAVLAFQIFSEDTLKFLLSPWLERITIHFCVFANKLHNFFFRNHAKDLFFHFREENLSTIFKTSSNLYLDLYFLNLFS